MRLLKTEESDKGHFEIREFADSEIPEYAILSHTWGHDEVTFQDMKGTPGKDKEGYQKVEKCCSIANGDGFHHVWIDTCCIDKTSSAELSEAINSMYRWYQEAKVCYAYLADVSSKQEISRSNWFTRGWTLQELIAPSEVIFLNKNWTKLGTKEDFRQIVSECTRIPVSILKGEDDLEAFSIAQRMSWAANRKTTRIEDSAYCLMGIFGINMSLIYGERETAFIRLQEEIMRISDDHSLFAWKSSDSPGGLLAASPVAFTDSGNIVQFNPFDTSTSPPTVNSRGIHLELRFIGIGSQGLGLAVLHCRDRAGKDEPIAIYLKDLDLTMQRFERVRSGEFKCLDLRKFRPSQYPIRRICIRKGYMTRMRKSKDLGKCDGIAPEIYPDNMLIHLMNFGEPRALMWAVHAAESRESVVWLLLTRTDIDANLTDEDGQTALLHAAREGHEAVVKMLLARSDVKADLEDEARRTPLWWATQNGHEVIVRLLLNKAANVEAPLLWAAKNGHEAVVRLLLDEGANIEAISEFNQTPLSLAAKTGHEDIVRLLLDKGANIEAINKFNQTPLLLAAENRHRAIMWLLLNKGANIEAINKFNQTPLLLATENGHIPTIQLLLNKGANIEAVNKFNQTPLLLAAKNGHKVIIWLLLNKGANIEAIDEFNQTPLLLATENGHEAIVQLLLDKGANIEAVNKFNQTPLLLAAKNSHEAIIWLLLDKAANVEAPLLWAAKNGHEAIVQLLLNKGANIEAIGEFNQTPLSLAVENGHEAIVQLLLNKGANIEAIGEFNQTPLSLATENGHEAIVQLLLNNSANIEAIGEFNQTPLSLAVENGHEAIVQLLLNNSANIEAIDKFNQTPLLLATKNMHEAIIRLLLDKGANIEAINKFNQTPLLLAAENGYKAVVRLLLDKGANIKVINGFSSRVPLAWHEAVVRLLKSHSAT